MQSSEKDFDKLRKDLENLQEWPSDYIFKFIIHNNNKKKDELLSKFDLTQCRLSSKESSNKKYVSLTLIMHMNNTNEVIEANTAIVDISVDFPRGIHKFINRITITRVGGGLSSDSTGFTPSF